MSAFPLGIDRNRTYTREEICSRYGYEDEVAEGGKVKFNRNRNRFFRDNFLARGLNAVKVGKTYEVAGEIWYSWTLANSRPCLDDDAD